MRISDGSADVFFSDRCRALLDGKRFALDLQFDGRHAAVALAQGKLKRLPFGEAGQAGRLDCGNVDEDILSAILADDEAETLLLVEELDRSLAGADYGARHAATATRPEEHTSELQSLIRTTYADM